MKIAIILPRVPFPLEKGDKLRAYHQIKHLSQQHEIHLFALDADHSNLEKAKEELSPYCKSIHFYSLSPISIAGNVLKAMLLGKPLQVGYFYNKKVAKSIHKLLDEIKVDHIYCQLIRTAEYAKNLQTKKTIDYQDVFSMGAKRQIKSAAIWFKPALVLEYKRLKKYEAQVFEIFDNKTIISEADRVLIDHPKKNEIKIVLNGVDFDFFNPRYTHEKKFDLVFTGNMSYAPNVDASEFLIKEIMPLVWKKLPETKVQLAGATPDKRVSALASEKVTVTGWIDDIRDAYASSKVFIAPMRIGTGLQNKLLEAMAMEMPAITSSLANDALHATNGNEILVGDHAAELAQHIIDVLEKPNLGKKLSQNGRKFILAHYSWKAASSKLEELIIRK